MSRNWSVRINPPPAAEFPRDLFHELFIPSLVSALARGPDGDSLGWPDRGWNSQEEYDAEMAAGLASESGQFIAARAQSESEATSLRDALIALGIPSEAINVQFPAPLAGALRPPPRLDSTMTESLELCGQPGGTNLFVVTMHLHNVPSSEFSNRGPVLLAESRGLILSCIGRNDEPGGHPQAYVWPERGWDDSDEFDRHSKNHVRQLGFFVLARNLTRREASVIAHRIQCSAMPFDVHIWGPEPAGPIRPLSEMPALLPDSQCPRFIVPEGHRVNRNPGGGNGDGNSGGGGGNGGGNGARPDIAEMLMHLERLVKKKKPAAAKSVIDSLPRLVATAESLAAAECVCCICRVDVAVGETYTELPCHHVFHLGTEESECEGIVPWLKDNNDCPLCRRKLESEPAAPGGSPDLLGLLSMLDVHTAWTCVVCDTENPAPPNAPARMAHCTGCNAPHQTTLVARGRAAGLIDRTVDLYLESESAVSSTTGVSSKGRNRGQLQSLAESFIEDPDVASLEESGWRVTCFVAVVMAPFTGSYNISLGGIDFNTAVLLTVVFRKIREKLSSSRLHVEADGAGPEVVAVVTSALRRGGPVGAAGPADSAAGSGPVGPGWTCPRCAIECPRGKDCSRCFAESKVELVMATKGQPFADRVIALLRRADDIGKTFFSQGHRKAALMADVEAFVAGPECAALTDTNWAVKKAFSILLRSILSSPRHELVIEGEDKNSVALMYLIVKRVNDALGRDKIVIRDCATLENGNLWLVEQFFSSPRPHIQPHVKDFIRATTVLVEIVRLIVKESRGQASEADWAEYNDVVIPALVKGMWRLEIPIMLMRANVRELFVLTEDIDINSGAVVDFMLFCLNKLEAS